MNGTLTQSLKQLKRPGIRQGLDVRLQEATANRLTHEQFLELILEDELVMRKDRLIERRIKTANFRDRKTFEDFDWEFNTSINKSRIFDLATGDFIRKAADLLFIGPPGVGKSHLVQAIGIQAIKSGHSVYYRSIFDLVRDFMRDEAFADEEQTLKRSLKPHLLIIDDMGIKQLPRRSGEYLFEVIMRRYEVWSTIMNRNRPIEEWGKLIGDVPTAGAILDRFLHHADVIAIEGKSYRLKDRPRNQAKQETKVRAKRS